MYKQPTSCFKERSLLLFSLLVISTFFGNLLVAQSLTTGDVAGVISDQTGAVIPGATVKLTSLDTGAVQSTATNQQGYYRFSLVMPNRYKITAGKTGFESVEISLAVSIGTLVSENLTIKVGASTQTVEVTEVPPLLSTEASNSTSFSPTEVAALPSAGGDITNIAFTAPGVVVNNMGGYGNFMVNGLPATSNLFTVNGENDMDPYFNINNTGATNLTLGANELQEAVVVTNAYSGQYGTFSGAQVQYVTRSGTNQFHGNIAYTWNGRVMNANDWFNNFYGEDRPFSNANQWAAAGGGPIIKNKMFFFVNNEGLRFVLPNVDHVIVPTAAFANAVLANVQAKQPAEFTQYQTMFKLWAGAPGAASAVPYNIGSSCTGLSLPGFNAATTPCAAQYNATPTALASEWILSARVDYNISSKDSAYFRWRLDHGTQPTQLNPINSNFDAISHQPAWDTQFSETHIFGPTSTNVFLAAFSHYVAQFQQDAELAGSTLPYGVATSGAVPFTGLNSSAGSFPQGRNVTQYQFVDDITVIRGKHDLKFGGNFRRYDVSDHNFFFNTPVVYFGYTTNGLQQFVNGLAYQYRGSLNEATDVPIALWGLGAYVNDDWHVKSNFKLTLGLRFERNSNPVCQFNCFANFTGAFPSLASMTSSSQGNVPYSSDIAYNQHQAFPGVDAVNVSPRLGFSWSPGKDSKTVVSGGFGIFYDPLPAGLVDNLLANPPAAVAIRVRPAAGVLPFDPGPKGGPAILAASQQAFSITKTYTQISSELAALGSVFAVPAVTSIVGTMHAPTWYEWNFQIQRQLTGSMVLSANYVGNHGIRIPYTNQWPNAFDQYGLYPGVPGIPGTVPNTNYGVVSQVQSGGVSSYNALNVTLRKQFSHGLTAHFNYTYAHNLDEASNGGVFTAGDSTLTQINPLGLRQSNYGNSDYDIRHNFSADWVYVPSVHMSNKFMSQLLGGWEWAGKIFWRSGLPFSITDNNTALGNYSGTILATYAPGGTTAMAQPGSCGAAAATTSCLNPAAFVDANAATFNSYAAWSTQNRNQFRGPGYFDTDMTIFRTFRIKERVTMKAGIQAFNIFNHPNFANPDSGFGDSTFGQITGMAGTPTSPYGSFLGFDSSPRIIQLSAKITF
jgi:Carboxypeptidase regulatory-like domain